jgi:hypothetical protein
MDVRIDAAVCCTVGPGGRSSQVVVNPITEQVTHLVVKGKHPPHTERRVPFRSAKAE